MKTNWWGNNVYIHIRTPDEYSKYLNMEECEEIQIKQDHRVGFECIKDQEGHKFLNKMGNQYRAYIPEYKEMYCPRCAEVTTCKDTTNQYGEYYRCTCCYSDIPEPIVNLVLENEKLREQTKVENRP